MRRFLLIVVIALLVLIALVAGTAWYLLGDEAFVEEHLGSYVLEQTGRELHIDGALRIEPGRVTRIEVHGLRLQNAPWAAEPDMISLGHLQIAIDLFSLFGDQPVIPTLLLEDCAVNLQENEDGEANWDVLPSTAEEEPDAGGGLPVALLDARVGNCRLSHDAPTRPRPLLVAVKRLALGLRDGDQWEVQGAGTVNDEPLNLSGSFAPAGALVYGLPLRYEIDAALGQVTLHSAGDIDNPLTGEGADLTVQFSGPEFAGVLSNLALPAVSEGAFDFRLKLDSKGDRTRLELHGDLGNLNVEADGSVDRLVHPKDGAIKLSAKGPNLAGVATVLGLPGIIPGSFSLTGDARFEQDRIESDSLVLESEGDRIELSGRLGTSEALVGSDLTVHVSSREFGRWRGRFGIPADVTGPAKLDGRLVSDAEGWFTIDAGLEYAASTLHAKGRLGQLPDRFEPDLELALESPDLAALTASLGLPGAPAAPIDATGTVSYSGDRIRIDGMQATLDGHRLALDGYLNPVQRLAGSELTARIDSPDVAGLALLFGVEGLPHESLDLSGTVRPEGKGLAFKTQQGTVGDIRLEVDGRIADLARPLELDATFDVRLPRLAMLEFLLPDTELPDVPLSASGRLESGDERVRLGAAHFAFGKVAGEISGDVFTDRRFDLKLSATGPDAAQLEPLIGQALPPEPFSVDLQAHGNAERVELEDIEAKLGASEIRGKLRVEPGGGSGAATVIRGRLEAPVLDLAYWTAATEEAVSAEPAAEGRYVFDDTPVMRVADIGLDADLRLDAAALKLANTTLDDVGLSLRLNRQLLQIDDFGFRGQGSGHVDGRLTLDSSGDKPRLDVALSGQALRLGLAAGKGQDIMTSPPVDLEIALQGSGVTLREMASGLDGRVRVYGGEGKIASSSLSILFNDFLTELLSALNPFSEKSEYTTVECIVAAADIKAGQVTVTPLVYHQQDISISAEGEIDLQTEDIDISFHSKPRKGLGLSASALVNPLIKVGGTLKEPAIELDPGKAVVSSGLAVATAGISILAKSMSDRFLSSKDPCGDARKVIAKRDAAGENP